MAETNIKIREENIKFWNKEDVIAQISMYSALKSILGVNEIDYIEIFTLPSVKRELTDYFTIYISQKKDFLTFGFPKGHCKGYDYCIHYVDKIERINGEDYIRKGDRNGFI